MFNDNQDQMDLDQPEVEQGNQVNRNTIKVTSDRVMIDFTKEDLKTVLEVFGRCEDLARSNAETPVYDLGRFYRVLDLLNTAKVLSGNPNARGTAQGSI